MKLTLLEKAPSGYPAADFRINIEELVIIKGLMNQANIHTPATDQTRHTRQRIKSMLRRLNSQEVDNWLKANQIKPQ